MIYKSLNGLTPDYLSSKFADRSSISNYSFLKHGAILYNEAEVFSLSITNPNGRTMLGLFTQV